MKACNRKILELFYNAKHTGRIVKPEAVGRVGEDDEGLVIEITWRVIDGVITDAKFRAFANPNAIAITSLMVDNMIGKSPEDVLELGEKVIIDNLGEFLPEYLEVYDMVRSCIVEAYESYQKRTTRKESTRVYSSKDYYQETDEEVDINVAKQIQRELQGVVVATETRGRGRPRKIVDETQIIEVGEKRGRGRPRKEVDPNAPIVAAGEKRGRGRPRKIVDESLVVEVGEKRGRGRPRKEVDANQVIEVGEKRGRGRPRKIVDESLVVEVGEKRGRGRPRKEVDPNAPVVEVGEKRGRGRPRKEVDPNQVIEVGEKRGRGRPRKIVDESLVVEVGEKRGRGRPRKEVDPNEVVEVGEKRGRGRPRKEIDPNQTVEIGEKRGRGRPKKEVKFNLPSDLDEVEYDEEMDELINGSSHNEIVKNYETKQSFTETSTNKLIDEDDETFDADYDLFKSNIRSIFSGKEVSNKTYGQKTEKIEHEKENVAINNIIVETEQTKPIEKEYKDIEIVDDAEEKRGRGRPRKDAIPNPHAKSSVNAVSSITRSLTPNSMPVHSSQDIVFASKNVTTTNININVTKTTTSVDDKESSSNDYSHNISTSERRVEVSLPSSVIKKDEEIDVEPVKVSPVNKFEDLDDDFDDIDTSKIKDEAPSGGLEDLLKALLDD